MNIMLAPRFPTSLRVLALLFATTASLFAIDLRLLKTEVIVTRGSGTTTVTNLIPNEDGTISIDAEQSGTLAHIGNFTATFAYVANIDPNTGTTLLTGEGTFHTTNGDTFSTSVSILEVGANYPKPLLGVLKITGGTGRFSGASGFLQVDGIDEESLTDSFQLSGTITVLNLLK